MFVIETKYGKDSDWSRRGVPYESEEGVKKAFVAFLESSSFKVYHAARTRKLEEGEPKNIPEPAHKGYPSFYPYY